MIAEALRVLTVMVPVLRPVDPHSGLFVDSFSAYKPCMQKVDTLYTVLAMSFLLT